MANTYNIPSLISHRAHFTGELLCPARTRGQAGNRVIAIRSLKRPGCKGLNTEWTRRRRQAQFRTCPGQSRLNCIEPPFRLIVGKQVDKAAWVSRPLFCLRGLFDHGGRRGSGHKTSPHHGEGLLRCVHLRAMPKCYEPVWPKRELGPFIPQDGIPRKVEQQDGYPNHELFCNHSIPPICFGGVRLKLPHSQGFVFDFQKFPDCHWSTPNSERRR